MQRHFVNGFISHLQNTAAIWKREFFKCRLVFEKHLSSLQRNKGLKFLHRSVYKDIITILKILYNRKDCIAVLYYTSYNII